jgi:hypothetical protein
MRSRNRFSPLAILLALGLSACSGAGGGTAPSAPGAPQQPSQPGAATATHTYTLGSAASSYAIPSLAGFGGSVAMPAATVPAATTLSLTSALKAPAGGPAFPTAARPKDAGTLNVYFYTTIQLSATITFQSLPGFSLTLPATINPAGQQFFYAVSTSTPNSGAVQSFSTQGPATVAGQTVTFTPTNTPLTLLAGTSYIVAFYATSATAATPTPTPTATPTAPPTATPTPTPTPTSTPTPANFTGRYTGSAQDSLEGSGSLSLALVQNGSTVSGYWGSGFPISVNGGTVSGTITGSTLKGTITSIVGGGCSGAVSATLNGSTLTGSYAGTTPASPCTSDTGSFTASPFTAPTIGSSYAGPLSDSILGPGTLDLTITTNDVVFFAGNWTATWTTLGLSNNGELYMLATGSSALELSRVTNIVGDCSGIDTSTVAGTTISGSYVGECPPGISDSGTYTVTQQ